MRKLGLIGDTRLRLARNLLPDVVGKWHEQWCFSSVKGSLQVDILEHAALQQTASGADWQYAPVGYEQIRLAGNWQALVFASHQNQAPDDDTARHLIEQAKLALVNAILDALQQTPVAALNRLHLLPAANPLSSDLVVVVGLAGAEVQISLDVGLLNSALPASVAKSLTARSTAIGKAKVRVNLQIPFSISSLDSIQGIKPGDVLAGDTGLMEPAQLKAGGNKLAHGYLARQDKHLAVQLIP